jgi:lysyl-tRNA synthetase class 2
MLERDRFFKNYWSRFPPAPAGAYDVGQFLKGNFKSGTVCGRVTSVSPGASKTHLVIASNGESLHVNLSTSLSWLEPQIGDVAFDLAVLSVGDLIALQIVREPSAAVTFSAQKLLILAPSSADSWSLLHKGQFDFVTASRWNQMVAAIRDYFARQDFQEMRTPTLVPSPGTEPFLDPFKTEWKVGSSRKTLYLPTSPEFHLKKMLVRGWTRIFEFKPCFRNGEIGEAHQPEFTMLEWYRSYADLSMIANDVENIIRASASSVGQLEPVELERKSMSELFANAFSGFKLTATTTRSELAALADKHDIEIGSDESFDDIFFRLFLGRIERTLGIKQPILVYGYPPSQAALARLQGDGFADRFEIYWRGFEIANAFHELNDPEENLERFRQDAEKKRSLNKEAVPLDDELIGCLFHGLPPSAGIALGVDRLFMALTGHKEISVTRAFPMRLPISAPEL